MSILRPETCHRCGGKGQCWDFTQTDYECDRYEEYGLCRLCPGKGYIPVSEEPAPRITPITIAPIVIPSPRQAVSDEETVQIVEDAGRFFLPVFGVAGFWIAVIAILWYINYMMDR